MLIIYAQQIFEKKAYVIFCGYAEDDVRNADMLIVWINIYKWACITQFCKVVWVLIDFGIAFSWKSQVTTLHGVLSFCPEQHLNKPLHSPNEISLFSIKQISIMIAMTYRRMSIMRPREKVLMDLKSQFSHTKSTCQKIWYQWRLGDHWTK